MRNGSTYLCFALLFSIAGCGGGSGSGNSASATGSSAVTGTVFAASISGADLVVKDTGGNKIAGPVTTSTDGSFIINIPNEAILKDLVFESSSGTFSDEATGTVDVSAGSLRAYVSGNTIVSGSSVHLTPTSTIIADLAKGGMDISSARATFAATFNYVPDVSIKPADSTVSPAAATAEMQRLAGLREAAFSQLTNDLGLPPDKQFEVLEAIADDLSDGSLDGMKMNMPVATVSGTTMPEDIINRYERAFIKFYTSDRNKTGLAEDKIGALPFAKVALTPSYRVQYVSGETTAREGKTTFQLKITKRSDGTAAAGLAPAITPVMFMSGHYTHSTPLPADGVIESTQGTYNCTIYYIMASVMNGVSTGYWELKVVIGGEEAYFYPTVEEIKVDTYMARLKNDSDRYTGDYGIVKTRAYHLWKDGFSGATDNHTFSLFVSAEDANGYPPIDPGTVMEDQNGTSWTINTVDLMVSIDGINWAQMAYDGKARWSASGLKGLTAGSPAKIYIEMAINGINYTTDGKAASGANSYATFNVTP